MAQEADVDDELVGLFFVFCRSRFLLRSEVIDEGSTCSLLLFFFSSLSLSSFFTSQLFWKIPSGL